VLLVLLVGGSSIRAPPPVPPRHSTIPITASTALRKLFMTDAGIVVGWTHYLAFDLFVGLWISRDADAKGFSRLVQAPILLLTFLAGPLACSCGSRSVSAAPAAARR
jgi:hypothetical protein